MVFFAAAFLSVWVGPVDLGDFARMTGLPDEALVGLGACLAGAALMWLLVMAIPVASRKKRSG